MTPQQQQYYLDAMGITPWVSRTDVVQPEIVTNNVADVSNEPEQVVPVQQLTPEPSQTPDNTHQEIPANWPDLQSMVQACELCELSRTRINTVFGSGNSNAKLMIIGEAPGQEEDKQGVPFVGPAGQLLTAMLMAMGMSRGDVYIANIIKCHPPGNRNPHVNEVKACQSYLQQQIALVKPQLILSVGGVSSKHLLATNEAVGKLRGRLHFFGENNIPLIVTYHPAYLIREPAVKAKSWQDLQQVMAFLEQT